MSFNSLLFLPFVVLVFVIYWYLFRKSVQRQNMLLLLASLFFIGYNDWQALCVISITGLLNFVLVQRMNLLGDGNRKKWFFYGGIALNVAVLCYFKYLNEILQGISLMMQGAPSSLHTLALPLGLSFFTFQLLAYWIDVYNEEVIPESNLLNFSVYLFYFPKIVSGPIELAQNFLPQMNNARFFDIPLFTDGLRQFLWGFFKKTVVSMHCLGFYNMLNDGAELSGFNVILAGTLNIVYIYADFSGYSDMACGISKLFGIRITNNFAFPFFSASINEFWKKWHISLTAWVVRYIFTPLSFILRTWKKTGIAFSILISFLVVGIWHGLKWNYVVFGLLHGVFFLPLVLRGGGFNSISQPHSLLRPFQMIGLFLAIGITSLFFREVNIAQTIGEIQSIFSSDIVHLKMELFKGFTYLMYWFLIAFSFMVEYVNRDREHGLELSNFPIIVRWSAYSMIILFIFFFSVYSSNTFVYVQF